MLRRRERPESLPRLDAARATISQTDRSSSALSALDDVEKAVRAAQADRTRLDTALDQLDPDRALAELKAALRSRPAPDVPDTDHIVALRRRHESIHTLKNRRHELGALIERAFADAETLAATVVTTSALGPAAGMTAVDDVIERMTADARALAAAHDEVARIGADPS